MGPLIEVQQVQAQTEQKKNDEGTSISATENNLDNASISGANGNKQIWLTHARDEGRLTSDTQPSPQTPSNAVSSINSDFAAPKGYENPVQVVINERAVAEIDNTVQESEREASNTKGVENEGQLKVDPEQGLGNIREAQSKLNEAPMLSVWGRMIDIRDRMWTIARRLFEKLPTFPQSLRSSADTPDTTSPAGDNEPKSIPNNEPTVNEKV